MRRILSVSDEWLARARQVIPGGTQTASKLRSQWVEGYVPSFLQRGRGGHVWDVDGNEWIDLPMALGPIVLGHAEPSVDEAIVRQLRDGVSFTFMHPLEVEVAERIVALCPGVDAVRFAKTGSDATSAAVRAARASTGREHVLVCGYHGRHDWYVASTPNPLGVPRAAREQVSSFRFNDLDQLGDLLAAHDVAAVVLEPSRGELPAPGFLQGVVDACRDAGAVSVFDELITGFRIAVGGARQRYGVYPDLSCYGKALGNGMPIAAVAGRREIMQEFERTSFAGTHGGEALSLAAARAVLDAIGDGVVLAGIDRAGERLRRSLLDRIDRRGLADVVQLGGESSRLVMAFSGDDQLAVRTLVQRCMAEHGVLFNGTFMLCARHTESDLASAVEAFDSACSLVAGEQSLSEILGGDLIAPASRTY